MSLVDQMSPVEILVLMSDFKLIRLRLSLGDEDSSASPVEVTDLGQKRFVKRLEEDP